MSDPILVDRTGASEREAEERFSAVWDCAKCGHADDHDEDMTCLVDVGPCQCAQCLSIYASGGAPSYSELCGCPGVLADDDPNETWEPRRG